MKKPSVTLVDVAKEAGVSVMTASRALSGKGYISEATRVKVQFAADELGYSTNALARMMKGGVTNVVGVVINDLSSSVTNAFASAISAELRRHDMDLFIYDAMGDFGGGKGERIGQMLNGLWDGLIYVLPRMSDSYLRLLEKNSSPIVLINYCRQETTLPVVLGDNLSGSQDAVNHLIELGHRRIGFIRGSVFTGQSIQRENGYRKAMADAGLEILEEWISEGDFSKEGGLEAGKKLMTLKEPPTAIFAANDSMAIGCMRAVREAGCRIPEDVSIVGFDDIPMSTVVQPRLTTLRHPISAMAQAAVKELLRRINGQPGQRKRIEFPSEFVIRESTGAVHSATRVTRRRNK